MVVQRPDPSTVEQEVLQTVRQLLESLGGSRALAAVDVGASLERDLGLGSLERVELVSRLEAVFAIELPESVLSESETAADLVRAILACPARPTVPRRQQPVALGPAPSLPVTVETLVEVICQRAEAEPGRPHIYLESESGVETIIRYGELQGEASEIASGLVGRGVGVGDPVALMLPTSREFFTAFAGILLAGAVPVPLYPPFSLERIQEYVRRQADILWNCQASVLITVQKGRTMGHYLGSRAPRLRHVTTVEALRSEAGAPSNLVVDPDAPVLIQYTSGSTGDPKGVLLTHRNLLANMRALGTAIDLRPTDVGVSWLPLYHDMGLIGCWLTPLLFGFPVTIMSPLAFLSRPERWLWTVHARRATLSAAPNFGYELCVRRIKDEALEGLDLSCWRGALNGAERVSAGTMERFISRFSRYGFRPESMMPVYGLAESSLALAASETGRKPRVERISRERFEKEGRAFTASDKEKTPFRFVSAGQPIPGHEIRVVDERGQEVSERVEGHLQFRGPSTMKGYFRNPIATESVRKPEGWMDSGDRAFLIDGEVFITGRLKDIIIRAGRNLYAEAIEEVVAEVEGVRRGCVVAFGVDDPTLGTEKVVVVAETREESDGAKREMIAAIQRRLTEALGFPPDDIVLSPPRTVPKTSSGKLRRSSCREQYLRGELAARKRKGRLLISRLAVLSSLLWLQSRLFDLGRLAYGLYVLFVAFTLFLPVWGLSWILPSRRRFARVVRLGVKVFLHVAGYRVRVEGLGPLQSGAEEPFVLVSNHASYIDPLPLLASLPLDFAFVVKGEAMRWPVLGRIMSRLGHLPVERGDLRESVSDAERLGEALRRGRSLFFFPEGTFTPASGLRPFRLGAFKLAAESGRAILPMSLIGTRRLLRDGTWLPRRSNLALVVGTPILARSATLAEMVRLRDEAADQIARHLGEPRLDLIAAGPQAP